MYLFKNIQNKWIFGTTIYDECPSGQYRVIYSSDFTKLSIRYMSDGTFVEQNRDVSYFKDSNGDPYANYISFSTSTDGFFANSPSSEAELAMSLAIGSKADVVATTDTGTFSLIALIKRALQGITTIFTRQIDGSQKAQWVDSALVEKGDIIRTFKVAITLPNNTNAYSAGDVITDISGALSQLTNVAKAAGYGVTIVGVRVQTTDPSGLAGKNLRWHIFNDSITPIADNAAFAINDVNTDKREGTITVTMGTGALSKVGQSNYENLSLNPVSRNIYLVLEHVDGGTPSANSTVINAYFKCLLTN